MRIARFLASAIGAAAVVTILPQAPPLAAPPGTQTVVVQCRQGWRGDAGGQYGGVAFQVSCQNGRAQQRLSGIVGSAYSVRMGVESDAVAGDCFFSGDASTVSESCLDVRLSIR
jgi:hypothetical protein